MTAIADTPEVLANSLAFLHMELTDPEFRHWFLVNARATTAGYRALLDDAVRAGELCKCDTEKLARLIQSTAHGSLVAWAFYREGTPADWLRRDMEVLLAPYSRAGKDRKRKLR
jgi:hypothetical protein